MGIRNLDRKSIRRMLAIGIVGCILTGAGDWLLGFAEPVDVGGGFVDSIVATAPGMSDAQLITAGLLGMVGLALEGVAFLAIARLMADGAPRSARIYRAGAIGYIWLAPIGCHMNVAVINYAYKYLWLTDPSLAHEAIAPMYLAFGVPVYALLAAAWVPMIVIQFRAFAKGLTPYPSRAKWFNLFVGAVPVLAISFIIGPETAAGGGLGTMFLSFGNLLTFGGLLATMPSEARFDEFLAALPS